jgi:hypothetical protein
MPGMNGKGPLGNGPLTGGQRGVCKQTENDKTDQPQDAAVNVVSGKGRGWGRCQGGAGRGAGKDQGRGRGRGGNS